MSNLTVTPNDRTVLRDLVKRYLDVCHSGNNRELRDLWRRHNNLESTRPLVLVMWGGARHESAECMRRECLDPFCRTYEGFLRNDLFDAALGADHVYEPWLTMRAHVITPEAGLWGLPMSRVSLGERLGWKMDPALKTFGDIDRMIKPHHRIDEDKTQMEVSRLNDLVGDLIPVVVNRGPCFNAFPGDLSTDVGYLRGAEQILWDMMDQPAEFHRLMAFLRDCVLQTHAEAEQAGDWTTLGHQNQSMPYAAELPDPDAGGEPVFRQQLWLFHAAQEFAEVSPEMHAEFLLEYQLPIMRHFGLVAYGCCENLTHKIPMLRRIPNLRRIAVTPWADIPGCAEQIGRDYVCSWRPNPAIAIAHGVTAERSRRMVREALQAFRDHGCIVDITLKDVHTLEGDIGRLSEWVRICRESADEMM